MIPGRSYTPEMILQIAWRLKWLIVLPAITIARRCCLDVPASRPVSLRHADSGRSAARARKLRSVNGDDANRGPSAGDHAADHEPHAARADHSGPQPVPRSPQDGDHGRHRRSMRSDIDTPVVRGDAFRVSFTSDDPRTAMRVAERLASMFIDESLRDREVLAEGTNQFLEAQLEDARRQLIDNEKKAGGLPSPSRRPASDAARSKHAGRPQHRDAVAVVARVAQPRSRPAPGARAYDLPTPTWPRASLHRRWLAERQLPSSCTPPRRSSVGSSSGSSRSIRISFARGGRSPSCRSVRMPKQQRGPCRATPR